MIFLCAITGMATGLVLGHHGASLLTTALSGTALGLAMVVANLMGGK